MKFDETWEALKVLSDQPENSIALDKWMRQVDVSKFLAESVESDTVILASVGSYFIQSILVPSASVADGIDEDLMNWNTGFASGYSCGYNFRPRRGYSPFVAGAYDDHGSKKLNIGLPLFFLRHNHSKENGSYIEINQQVAHWLNLHWDEEQRAWCQWDDVGDPVQVAKTFEDPDMGLLATMRKEHLDYLMFLSKSALVRCINVTRTRKGYHRDRSNPGKLEIWNLPKLKAKLRVTFQGKSNSEIGDSYSRGVQLIGVPSGKKDLQRRLRGQPARSYESFVVDDFRNKKICEASTRPGEIGNYFVEDNRPFGTSPAFFKPEVLLKYKQEPEKYTFHLRRVDCRGAWDLRYDVNEKGLVFAYLKDLSLLPHREQLHWKQYNIAPEGGLSTRAIEADFHGRWHEHYDPVESIRQCLSEFPSKDKAGHPVALWILPKLPKTKGVASITGVNTKARKEWEDQISNLSQVTVEGLQKAYLSKFARQCGAATKEEIAKLGSLKVLRRVLVRLGQSPEAVESTVGPLEELWDCRSKGVAHAASGGPKEKLPQHFTSLLTRVDRSMRQLAELIRMGAFSADLTAGGAVNE